MRKLIQIILLSVILTAGLCLIVSAEEVLIKRGFTEYSKTYHFRAQHLSDNKIQRIIDLDGVVGVLPSKHNIYVMKSAIYRWAEFEPMILQIIKKKGK